MSTPPPVNVIDKIYYMLIVYKINVIDKINYVLILVTFIAGPWEIPFIGNQPIINKAHVDGLEKYGDVST